MIATRRSFLRGLIAAPFVITTAKLLMPVKAIALPDDDHMPPEMWPWYTAEVPVAHWRIINGNIIITLHPSANGVKIITAAAQG